MLKFDDIAYDLSAQLASTHKQNVPAMMQALMDLGVIDKDLANNVAFAQTDEDYEEKQFKGVMLDECVYEAIKMCMKRV